ncbi:MAG TPA: response regulator [Candidatus Methylomirabilis sp.]|nr:response regulator [Candidatus Methylomirabilis sp.]
MAGDTENMAMTSWEAAPRLDGLRLLVVEDVPSVREVVVDALEQCGAKVTAVESAVEGLTAVQQERPDALLTSISMPGEDGYWLIRQIRSLPTERGCATPAVAFTGLCSSADRLEALRAGFQSYISKPVDLVKLVGVVAVLAGRQ